MLTGFRRFEEVAGNRLLADYGPNDFLSFRTTLASAGDLSPVTVENHLVRLRTLFPAAESEELLANGPGIRVHRVHSGTWPRTRTARWAHSASTRETEPAGAPG